MFNEARCASMILGRPQASLRALNEARAILTELGFHGSQGAGERPRNTKEQWQLELLLNAERINRLDARSRAAVVNLLACMLLEAARADEREVAGEA
jgi:hypothetical protein